MARNRCKDHLLETATELFSKNGFHATGIDTIIEEADVSRMSLYNNFASKDALINAVLERHHETIEEWMKAVLEGPGNPETKLNGLFDELGRRWNSNDFYGCPFINAAAEYSCPDDPRHIAAAHHKKRTVAMIAKLLEEMHVQEPVSVAEQVQLLIDGGSVRAQILDDHQAHIVAKNAVAAIIASAAKA